MMVSSMNLDHVKMVSWRTSHLGFLQPKDMIDLGCEKGKNAQELMQKYLTAYMSAIDYSNVFVEASMKLNANEVKSTEE